MTIRDSLVAYLDGEVTPQERQQIESMLAADPDLHAELDALREMRSRVIATLKAQAGEVEAPPLAPISSARQHRPNGRKPTMRDQSQRNVVPMAVAAALILAILGAGAIVAAGILVVGSGTASQPQVAPDEQVQILPQTPTPEPDAVVDGPEAPPMTDEDDDTPPTTFRPGYLPESFYAMREVSIVDEAGSTITERRHYGNEEFVLITSRPTSDDDLPEGEVIVVQGSPATLQADLSGTVLLEIDTLQDGSASAPGMGSGGGGGGGGGSPDDEPRLFPEEIAYEGGFRLTWDDGSQRIEVLSNLPREELLRVAESLTEQPVPPAPSEDYDALTEDLPEMPEGASVDPFIGQIYLPDGLPDGFYQTLTFDAWDEEWGYVRETRHHSNDSFVIIRRRAAQPGEAEQWAAGSLALRGTTAGLERSQNGAVVITSPILQDGIPRPLFGAGGGGGSAIEPGQPEPTFPDEIPYEEAILVTWVEEEVLWQVLTNLEEQPAFDFIESLTLSIPSEFVWSNPDGSEVRVSDMRFVPLFPTTLPESVSTAVGGEIGPVNLVFAFAQDENMLRIQQAITRDRTLPQTDEPLLEAPLMGLSRPAALEQGLTFEVNGQTYEDGIRITFFDGMTKVTLESTLSVDELLEVIRGLQWAEAIE